MKAAQVVADLAEEDVVCIEVRQGWKTQSAPMSEIEAAVLTRRLRYAPNSVLSWCVANVVPRRDRNGNLAPDRPTNDAKKIDLAVGLINAMVRAMVDEGGGSYLDDEEAIVL